MRNRLLVWFLFLLSAAWIGYVAYDLVYGQFVLKPQTVFGQEDGRVLIVNRTDEMNLEQVKFEANAPTLGYLQRLLTTKQSIRIFASERRPIVLIEAKSLWNKQRISAFLAETNIQANDKNGNEWQLENGFTLRFKNNWILISREKPKTTPVSTWPKWDARATANVISFSDQQATDIYFKSDGTVSFQTKNIPNLKGRQVYDAELFAPVLPAKLTNYHFYERDFAVYKQKISTESPLYTWLEYGFVEFEYEGDVCMISDYRSSQNPFAVLADRLRSEDAKKQSFQGVALSEEFPKNETFYVLPIADKIVISRRKEAAEKVVSDYQLGKTVALNEKAKNRIFGSLPRRVSERFQGKEQHFTRSVYKNVLIETYVQHVSATEEEVEESKQEEAAMDNTWSESIVGNVLAVLGRSGKQFIWTDAREIIATANKKTYWKSTFEGTLVNQPTWIDWNGKKGLFFHTDQKIYIVQTDGSQAEGFPLALDEKPETAITSYDWKGQVRFVYVSTSGSLIHLRDNGKVLGKTKLSVGTVKKSVSVFEQNGNPIALILGSEKSQTINLNSNRLLKSRKAIPSDAVEIQSADGPVFYFAEGGQLNRADYTGNSVTLGAYPNPTMMKVCSDENGKQFVAFASYGKIHVLNAAGVKLAQVDVPFKKLESMDVFQLSEGKLVIALVDAIENNVFVLDASGNLLTEKPLEGKGEVLLSEVNGKLRMTVSTNGFVVQYLDVLSNKSKL